MIQEKKYNLKLIKDGRPEISSSVADLLLKLLEEDPAKWVTAKDALNHQWFINFGKKKKGDHPKILENPQANPMAQIIT